MTLSPRQRMFVEVGRKEFVRNGYGSSSIRTIAQEAGVSLSALYYHYKNKQDLLLAILMDGGVDTYDSLWEQALRAVGDDPVEQLRAFVRANVEFRTQFPEHGRMIATEIRNLEPEGARLYDERRRTGRQRIRTIIDDGVAAGGSSRRSTRTTAANRFSR